MEDADWPIVQLSLVDPNAFRVLYERYYGEVYALLFRRTCTTEVAEDLTQDTFARALIHLKTYRPEYRFIQWLIGIALNELRQYIRKEKHRNWSVTKEQMEQLSTTSQLNETLLEKLLNRLPPRDLLLLELHYFEGMSYSQVANALGSSETAVSKKTHRLLQQLRKEAGNG